MPNFAVIPGTAAWATRNTLQKDVCPASMMSFFIGRLKTSSRSHLTQIIVPQHSIFGGLNSNCSPCYSWDIKTSLSVKCGISFLGPKPTVFALQGVLTQHVGAEHSSIHSFSKLLRGPQGFAVWRDRDKQAVVGLNRQTQGALGTRGQMSDPHRSRSEPGRKWQKRLCQANWAAECASICAKVGEVETHWALSHSSKG